MTAEMYEHIFESIDDVMGNTLKLKDENNKSFEDNINLKRENLKLKQENIRLKQELRRCN